MPKDYVYQDLDPERRQIRLLEVLPDREDQPIRIHIRTVQLPAAYETISYAWGDHTPSAVVEVRSIEGRAWPPPGSSQLRVPASTQAALRRIRFAHQSRTVWIDAISINQDDKGERSQQVAIMGRIYASSTANLVYLGELADDMTVRIQCTIANLLTHARGETDDLRTYNCAITGTSKRMQMRRQGLPFQIDIEAVCVLLELPWLRRLWVLQEVVMAPLSIAFLGQCSQFDLYDMFRAIIWWQLHAPISTLAGTEAILGFRCLLHLYYYRSEDGDPKPRPLGVFLTPVQKSNPSSRSLDALLPTAQMFQKSEPRDSVYALLALMEGKLSSTLKPDYTSSVSETLQSASRLAIKENPSFLVNIVHRAGDLEQADVASWALRVDRQIRPELDAEELPVPHYRTYTGPERRLADEDDPRVLNLKGHKVDTVSIVTPVCTSSVYENGDALLVWLWQVIELYTNISCSPDPETGVQELAIILCADLYEGRYYHELQEEEIRPLKTLLLAIQGPSSSAHKLYLLQTMNDSTPGFWSFVQHRRCFKTMQGRFGLGPGVMQAGDIVTVLSGAEHPYILRAVDDGQYQLVEAAYTHGIMQGELNGDLGLKEEETFALV
ncbi:hypothetical protein LTR97_009928 [Elasticomyces elasticus]|uniref:Heterokaryon incompatibility domain-containing protein n=1 Tax=Elasticomyces elasticus TaxID=574655 RepID=A0AAN7ZRX2_9PEZI|nr:hypothetical protein LTR97_009928 [Elasticomyces elasticus]